MSGIHPAVICLQVHLPNQQRITFNKDSNLTEIIQDARIQWTTLTKYFKINALDAEAKKFFILTFHDIIYGIK